MGSKNCLYLHDARMRTEYGQGEGNVTYGWEMQQGGVKWRGESWADKTTLWHWHLLRKELLDVWGNFGLSMIYSQTPAFKILAAICTSVSSGCILNSSSIFFISFTESFNIFAVSSTDFLFSN